MSKLKDIDGLLNKRHSDHEVIILRVRCYLRDELSFRDLADMMSERGLSLAHTTIMRRVKRDAVHSALSADTGGQDDEG